MACSMRLGCRAARCCASSGAVARSPGALAVALPVVARRSPRRGHPSAGRARLQRVRAASDPSSSDWPAGSSQDVGEEPAAALAACIAHIREGDLDALLEFVPDEVIDRVIEMRRCNAGGGEPSWLRFTDVLQANDASLLYLDSFAIRHLAWPGVPRSLELLSAVRVTEERYLQRCTVVSQSGEEAVLRFEMQQQDCLENQYRGPPLVRKRWMLRSVRGEPSSEAGRLPDPTAPPEAVLQAQLAALQDHRYADVFAHASPANKNATGPLPQFARMLQSPGYVPLLGHEGAETLQRLQPSPTVYMELVRVYPGGDTKARMEVEASEARGSGRGRRGKGGAAPRPALTYLWVLSRQPEGGDFTGSWMVDSVQPVDATPPAAPEAPPADA